jgi:hypothetical protein
MKRTLIAFAVFALTAQYATAQKKDIAEKYGKEIKAKKLKDVLSVIAGPEMKGRETATDGQRAAAAWIENYFKKLGLQPGNGKSFQMPYPLFRDSLINESLTVNGQSFQFGKDFLASVTNPNGKVTGGVVFAGLARMDSANNDLAGLNVKDKFVMIVTAPPAAGGQPQGTNRGNPMMQRMTALRNSGAKGVIVVSNIGNNPMQRLGNMSLKQAAPQTFVSITVTPAVAKAIMGADFAWTPGSATIPPAKETNATVTFEMNKVVQNLESTNVLGVLPGTDKKDEYVFITAHYDHLGSRGDSVIFYGADDDGSGTTGVLAIAEAFAQAKKKGDGPRRSIVFMAVSGEEKGLLGSEYYGDHPLFPLNKTTVDLNIDMVGRIDPKYKGDSMNYVYIIGDDKLSSDLRPITDDVNSKYGINMELDRRYNDVSDPNRFYYRSDHYNFAKHGVPIIFYFNGTHADYHRATDTVDKITFDLMEKRVRLVYYTAWEMANRDDMLKRDIPLNIPPR